MNGGHEDAAPERWICGRATRPVVFFRQLVDAENRDECPEVLVALQIAYLRRCLLLANERAVKLREDEASGSTAGRFPTRDLARQIGLRSMFAKLSPGAVPVVVAGT